MRLYAEIPSHLYIGFDIFLEGSMLSTNIEIVINSRNFKIESNNILKDFKNKIPIIQWPKITSSHSKKYQLVFRSTKKKHNSQHKTIFNCFIQKTMMIKIIVHPLAEENNFKLYYQAISPAAKQTMKNNKTNPADLIEWQSLLHFCLKSALANQ